MATDRKQTTVAKACRERKPNFSDAEIGLILEGIYKNRDVINNPETNAAINQQKNAVYKLITEKVNEVTRFEYGGSVERNVRDVKKKWIELKYTALKIHNTRNGLSKVKRSEYVPKESPFTQLVLDIIFGTDISGIETTQFGHNGYNRRGTGRQNSVTVPSVSSAHVTHGDSTFGREISSNSEMPVIKTEAEECLEQAHATHHDGVSREVTLSTVKPETMEMHTTLGFTDMDNSLDSDYAEISSAVKTGKKERERKQNFTEVEIATLLREVNKHKDVILMKDQNAEALKQKHQTWMQILDQCHKSRTSGVKRTVSEIQKKWRNLKLLAMTERKAKEKTALKGRPSAYTESWYTEQVTAILDGTFDDGPLTEVQEVDFEAMLTWDASTNQNQMTLLHHPNSSRSVLDENAAAKQKRARKANFSDAEILCLLKEIPKHYKILGKKLRTDQIVRSKELHWKIIADKVNACSDRGITRSWREVQTKFRALKLAALAAKKQRRSYKSRVSERNQSHKYDRLVLDILNKTSGDKMLRATSMCNGEGVEKGEDGAGCSNNKPQQGAERECGFPKRNCSENTTVSVEECECLVGEVDKFKDVLLVSAATETDDLRQKQRRAWRIATENVNKCSTRGFRWTAKELKQKWLELQRNAEHHQRVVTQGATDVTEPALFHRVIEILQALGATCSPNTEVNQPVQSVEVGNGNDRHSERLLQRISESTPKHPTLDKLNKDYGKIPDHGMYESLLDPQKEKDPISDESNDLEVDGSQDGDILDVDYMLSPQKRLERHTTTWSATARPCDSPLSPQKCTSALPAPAGPPNFRRVRKPNFSHPEVRIILDVYEANKDVLNCKKTDSATNNKKLRIWHCMVDKINNWNKSSAFSSGRPGTTRRTIKQVRKKLIDLRATAIKSWVNSSAAVARETQPSKDQSFVERVIKMMNIDLMAPEAFEIYQDIAEEEDEENEHAEKSKETKNDSSMAIQKHLEALVHICGQLKALGVDAGAVIFEKDTVMTCGSERMAHMAAHPQLADLLSSKQHPSHSVGGDQQSSRGDWKVTVLSSATATPAGDGTVAHSSPRSASTRGMVLVSGSPAVVEVLQNKLQLSRNLDGRGEVDNSINNISDRVDDQSEGSSQDVGFPAVEANSSDESEERANVKQKLKAMLLNRSSDTDDAPDASREQLSDAEFTPVGFHLQQPSASAAPSKEASFTCNLCAAAFPSLSTLILHKQSHRHEGCAGRRDGRAQQLEQESGRLKNPVVVLQKLPLDIVKRTSMSCQQRVDQQSRPVGCSVRRERGTVTCKQCGKRFTKSAQLEAHLQLHLSGRLLTCKVCLDTFTSRGRLLQHKQTKHYTSQPQIQARDTDPVLVITDEKGDGDNGDNDADDMAPNSENSEDLSALQPAEAENSEDAVQEWDTRVVKDSRERRFPCKFCGKRFFTSTHRRQHERIHTGERPFKCDVCGFSFTQSTSLTIHKRKHTGERPYTCDLCGYAFYSSSDVLAHKKKRHGLVVPKQQTQVDKYRCDVCSQVFPDITRLKTHTRKHTGEKPFSCDQCPRTFTEKHNLVRHKERHLGIKPFQCHICGTKFTEKGNLKVHMRYHSGEKPFKCEFCGEGFYVTSTLKIHRRKHTGERPYLCDLCGASFTQGGKLHSHRRKHTGEKPYRCAECGENFKEKDQLNIHRRKHTGIQPYTCKMCGKAMQKASHLANHIRVHTGEKPYACEICGEKFARTDVLGLHRKKHLNFAQLQSAGSHCQPSQPGDTSQLSPKNLPRQTSHEQPAMLGQGHIQSQAVAPASVPPVFVSPMVPPAATVLLPGSYPHV